MKETREEWRDVPGYEGVYQISIDTPEGRCRSFHTSPRNRYGAIHYLSNKPDNRGRLNWVLCKNKKQTTKQAASWIALTYPELVTNEYFEGAEIDHIDTNKTNNHPSNLRWVTRKENQNNPLTLKHLSEGGKGKNKNNPKLSKWVVQLNTQNEILHFYPSVGEAARQMKVHRSNITKCCNGTQKSACGCFWKYVS